MTTAVGVRMPPLAGATGWLNAGPPRPAELIDRPVLVNFWTLTCINWLRTEPYVRAWSRAYRDDGLLVIGVHTPEFAFEHDEQTVRLAVREQDIDYPIAIDNDYAIWSAFDNHYWPALYFVDSAGVIRDEHFGEGRYVQSERTIQALLGIERDLVVIEGQGVEAAADWENLRTPETYLRIAPTRNFASDQLDGAYAFPASLRLNHWALSGAWDVGPESVRLREAGGGIAIRFQARDAHLVLGPPARGPIPFRVLLDGLPPGQAHGVDVDEQGHGVLDNGRLYQLVRERNTVHERTLEVRFAEPGAEAYAFTFG